MITNRLNWTILYRYIKEILEIRHERINVCTKVYDTQPTSPEVMPSGGPGALLSFDFLNYVMTSFCTLFQYVC